MRMEPLLSKAFSSSTLVDGMSIVASSPGTSLNTSNSKSEEVLAELRKLEVPVFLLGTCPHLAFVRR